MATKLVYSQPIAPKSGIKEMPQPVSDPLGTIDEKKSLITPSFGGGE